MQLPYQCLDFLLRRIFINRMCFIQVLNNFLPELPPCGIETPDRMMMLPLSKETEISIKLLTKP
jgi:hypothetical protein